MTYIGVDTHPRRLDVAPELRRILESNGMQAHIARTESGNYQLITLSHDNKTPHYYNLTERQLSDLVNQGTNSQNKRAYNTFVSIVKNDYYVPGSWVAAKNVNSPVNMGLHGYTLSPGEYGIGRRSLFDSFFGPRYGRFDGSFYGVNLRRIGGGLFYDDRRYVVGERPDGRMVAGELKSGSYGFYSKPEQKNDVLANMNVAVKKPKPFAMTDEEKKKVTCLKDITWYQKGLGWATGDTINGMMATHGLELNEKDKTLTVKAKGSTKAFVYHLSDEDAKILFNQKIKLETKSGKIINKKDGNSFDERLNCINNIIKEDFDDKVTAAKLNEKDYISLKLNEKNQQEQRAELQPRQDTASAQVNDVIDLRDSREAYRTGFIDQWNSIGVVDGRQLDARKGFYLPAKNGRAVSVGEIQVYPSSDGTDRGQTYKMTAVINEKVFTHDISKSDYMKFLNYDDEHRLELFDKTFKEVQIKSSKNGEMVDPYRSDRIDNSQTAAKLEGNYSLVIGKEATTITAAMAWKDEVSGNYTLNVRDGKDAGMWSFKITEAQYQAFCHATIPERANMLTTMIPWNEQIKGNVRVVETSQLNRPLNTLQANGNVQGQFQGEIKGLGVSGGQKIRPEVLEELKAKGMGYQPSVVPTKELLHDLRECNKQVIETIKGMNLGEVKMLSDKELLDIASKSSNLNDVQKGILKKNWGEIDFSSPAIKQLLSNISPEHREIVESRIEAFKSGKTPEDLDKSSTEQEKPVKKNPLAAPVPSDIESLRKLADDILKRADKAYIAKTFKRPSDEDLIKIAEKSSNVKGFAIGLFQKNKFMVDYDNARFRNVVVGEEKEAKVKEGKQDTKEEGKQKTAKASNNVQTAQAINEYNVRVNGENLDLKDIQAQTRKNLLGDAQVNGESLQNVKENKEWKRSGEHGRSTEIGDITVEKMRDANGKPMEGKYIMSAVIDGNVVSHEINQKQYDKFLVVNDYQRMKLFDKIFPEVEMKTKEGSGVNLGAAILAAVTVGIGAAAMLSRRDDHQRPDVYMDVYSKPGLIPPKTVAAAIYEDKMQASRDQGVSQGLGRGF